MSQFTIDELYKIVYKKFNINFKKLSHLFYFEKDNIEYGITASENNKIDEEKKYYFICLYKKRNIEIKHYPVSSRNLTESEIIKELEKVIN